MGHKPRISGLESDHLSQGLMMCIVTRFCKVLATNAISKLAKKMEQLLMSTLGHIDNVGSNPVLLTLSAIEDQSKEVRNVINFEEVSR